MNCIWNEKERQFIRENAGKIKDQELATHLTQMTGRHVSLQSLRKQRRKLGIIKERGRGICKISEKKVVFSEKMAENGIKSPIKTDKNGAEEECVHANQA